VSDPRGPYERHALDLTNRMTHLTDDERRALDLTGELAGLCRQIIGDGPAAVGDWREMAMRIHAIQHMLMAQAASRAYPEKFRLLGRVIEEPAEEAR
jgi:hypothetical protein